MRLKLLQCHTRVHCRACRTDPEWTERVVGVAKFECPHGVTADNLPSRGLGDDVAKAIRAVTLGMVKPCGGCKKRAEKLNRLVPYKQEPKDGEEV